MGVEREKTVNYKPFIRWSLLVVMVMIALSLIPLYAAMLNDTLTMLGWFNILFRHIVLLVLNSYYKKLIS